MSDLEAAKPCVTQIIRLAEEWGWTETANDVTAIFALLEKGEGKCPPSGGEMR